MSSTSRHCHRMQYQVRRSLLDNTTQWKQLQCHLIKYRKRLLPRMCDFPLETALLFEVASPGAAKNVTGLPARMLSKRIRRQARTKLIVAPFEASRLDAQESIAKELPTLSEPIGFAAAKSRVRLEGTRAESTGASTIDGDSVGKLTSRIVETAAWVLELTDNRMKTASADSAKPSARTPNLHRMTFEGSSVSAKKQDSLLVWSPIRSSIKWAVAA